MSHPSTCPADAALRGNLRDQREAPHEQLGSAQGNLSRFCHGCAECADDCQRVGDMDECVEACPGLRGILPKNGGAVKRQNLICRTFRRTNAGIDSAGRAGRIGQVYIALGAA